MKAKVLLTITLFCAAPFQAQADAAADWTNIAVMTQRDAGEASAISEGRLALVDQAMALALAGTRGGAGKANGNVNGNGNGNGGHASEWDRDRREAAVAVAAFAVLEQLYPDQRENLDAQLALALSPIPETAAKAEGAELGRRVATEVIGARK